MEVQNLLPVRLLFLYTYLVFSVTDASGNTILKIDDNSYNNRSVGAPKIFSATFTTDTVVNLEWLYRNMNGTEIMIVRVGIVAGVNPVPDRIKEYNNFENRTVFSYDNTTSVRAMSMKFVYTTVSDMNSSIIIRYIINGMSTDTEILFNVANCSAPDKKKYRQVDITSHMGYGAEANYSCTNNAALAVNGFYDKTMKKYTRTCQLNATWSNGDADCWFAPRASVSLKQGSSAVANGVVTTESNVVINCSVEEDGYPIEWEPVYFYNSDKINESFTPKPGDNEARISCQALNKYVEDVNHTAGSSQPVTLDVHFAPVAEEFNKYQYAGIGQNYSLLFSFSANPRIYENGTELSFGGEKLNNAKASLQFTGFVHNYAYMIVSVNDGDFGEYTLTATSPSVKLQKPSENFTVSLNSTTYSTTLGPDTTTGPDTTIGPDSTPLGTTNRTAFLPAGNGLSNEALIGIICASVGILVILLVGILIWRLRQRKTKGASADTSAREERDNPLYGTAPGPSDSTEYASVDKTNKKKKQEKEEKANPLYESSGVTAATVETAYGVVDKKKKKKKNNKGKDNSAYSPENLEVTYAAVNKPKKNANGGQPEEAVYSAVNKKKNKKGADGEPELHGTPSTDL